MRLAATLAIAATPALAGLERMTLNTSDGACFAIIAIENRMGRYTAIETLDTEHGTVSVSYETIGNHNATDHDLVEVVDLPDGVAADPMFIELPDGETGFICLMEYLGG